MDNEKIKKQFPLGRNTGFIDEPPTPTDYIAGVASAVLYRVVKEDGDWGNFLPSDEKQHFKYFDSMACVSFSACNCIETQINYWIEKGIIDPEKIKDWLDEKGKFNGSDRAIAKWSGTTPRGNSMSNVANTIYKMGIPPEKVWPNPPEMSEFVWNKYYEAIPKSVEDWGKKFLQFFLVEYEYVIVNEANIEKHLKQAPIQIATPVCPGWFTEEIIKPCGKVNSEHATLLHGNTPQYRPDFDQYEPFKKKIAKNYPIGYIMKIIITPKKEVLKTNEKTMTTLYKTADKNTVYELWEDGLYHPIIDGSYVDKKYGGWANVEVKTLQVIAPEKVGSTFGEYNFFLELIRKLF